jgi:hypothetical protein
MEKVRHVTQRLATIGGLTGVKRTEGITDADDEASKELFEYFGIAAL